jgi:dihydrolipoamide dehydrogenase
MADRIASLEDEDISNTLGEILSGQGVGIFTGVKRIDVKPSTSGKLISAEFKDGRKETTEFDEILVATGRKPSLGELDLEKTGMETYPKGIKVNSFLETSVDNIWAVGDVTGPPYFTYIGNRQGKTAALNAATGMRSEFTYDVLPRATFCDPEIGSVGLTEAQAREQGFKVKAGRFNYADLTRPVFSGETEGFIKVIAEEGSGRILGGHIIGSEASTLIHEIAAAMEGGLSVVDIGRTVHSYPTFSEGIRYACETII